MTPTPSTPPEVFAAGGVPWRRDGDTVQVMLVHRPRYDDWTLPKGKLDDHEDFATAATREVLEETGVSGALGEDLGEAHYVDHRGRHKVVRWWAIEALSVAVAEDTHEVDEQRWMTLDEARDLLTYLSDVEVLERFRATVLD